MILPDVYFGSVDAEPVDWRKKQDDSDSFDDDELLDETPKDVIDLLGFDPKELGVEKIIFGPQFSKGGPGSGNFGHSGRPGDVGGSGEGGESDRGGDGGSSSKDVPQKLLSYGEPWYATHDFSTANLDNISSAKKEFVKAIFKQYRVGDAIPIYHESPIKNLDSILDRGLTEDTNFGTIGKPSGFISGDKVIVVFDVPKKSIREKSGLVVPDARYGGESGNSYKDLLGEHKGVWGADVSVGSEIPKSWIVRVWKVSSGNYERMK